MPQDDRVNYTAEQHVGNLVMLVARLVHQARLRDPNDPVAEKAMDYLRRADLTPTILRGGYSKPEIQTMTTKQRREHCLARAALRRALCRARIVRAEVPIDAEAGLLFLMHAPAPPAVQDAEEILARIAGELEELQELVESELRDARRRAERKPRRKGAKP